MPPVLRTVIIDSDPEARATLRRLLASMPSAAVVREFPGLSGGAREISPHHPDVLIVEVSTDKGGDRTDGALRVVQELVRALPTTAIIATGASLSAEFVLQVLRAGAVEFLPRPVEQAHLLDALNKVSRFQRTAAPLRRSGRLISVFSTKGGVGVTTLATNLAVCLAERDREQTLLVELDTRHADVAIFLNLRPRYSVLDAFESCERLDESFLRGLLVRHASGLYVLPAPPRTERVQLNPEQVHTGLEIMRSHFAYVVLDLRHDFDPGTLAALELSDSIVFVTALDVSALRSAAAGVATFRLLGLDLQKVRTVVMREDSGDEVTLKQAREALGLPIAWKTPNDYRSSIAAINSGTPVVTAAPRSKLAKSLRHLADVLSSGSAPAAPAAHPAASLLRFAWTAKGAAGGR